MSEQRHDALRGISTPSTLEAIFAQSILPSAFFAAVRLGFYTCLDATPTSSGELAERLRLSERATVVLADAQVAIGLVQRLADGRYCATAEAAEFLNPNGAGYCLPVYDEWLQAIRDLNRALTSDQPNLDVTQPDFEDVWSFYARKSIISWQAEAQSACSDWSAVRSRGLLRAGSRVAYFGCGAGVFVLALALMDPKCFVSLFDRTGILTIARQVVDMMGIASQVEYSELEISSAAPVSTDAATSQRFDMGVFRETLHYIRPEEIVSVILRANSAAGGINRFLVVGRLMAADRSGPRPCQIDNIYMSAVSPHWTGYTPEELSAYFASAGYPKTVQVTPTIWMFS